MRTMRKINKPIKFFGLSSGQFAVFMLVVWNARKNDVFHFAAETFNHGVCGATALYARPSLKSQMSLRTCQSRCETFLNCIG